MRKFIETTGRSEEDAISAALFQLGLDRDDISVEVLERAKSGFLGFGSSPAKVRVYYGPEEEEKISAPAPEPKKPEPQREPEAYKGFLIIRCEQFGEIRAFCAKTPITRNTCKCGHTTELHDLKPLHLKCKCGSTFNYRTNVTDGTFEWPCLNCGSPVDLELNRRGDTYVTVGD